MCVLWETIVMSTQEFAQMVLSEIEKPNINVDENEKTLALLAICFYWFGDIPRDDWDTKTTSEALAMSETL